MFAFSLNLAYLLLSVYILHIVSGLFVALMLLKKVGKLQIGMYFFNCRSNMDGGFRETRHLKDLLLVNLDLIQRQQELLSEKDKRIQHLQHENESVRTVRTVYLLTMLSSHK